MLHCGVSCLNGQWVHFCLFSFSMEGELHRSKRKRKSVSKDFPVHDILEGEPIKNVSDAGMGVNSVEVSTGESPSSILGQMKNMMADMTHMFEAILNSQVQHPSGVHTDNDPLPGPSHPSVDLDLQTGIPIQDIGKRLHLNCLQTIGESDIPSEELNNVTNIPAT